MQKNYLTLLIVLALLAATAVGAQSDSKESVSPPTPEAATSGGHSSSKGVIVGNVTETLDAGRYLYVEVDTGEKRVWAAGPQAQVKVGDSVYFPSGMPMVDFVSKSLGRKFDLLYMVDAIRVASSGTQKPGNGASDSQREIDTSKVEPADGGYTVAQIFEHRVDLSGREVAIRGRIVKFNRGIMGRNWVHLQDGTVGPEGANDLVVTTNGNAEVGSIVLVRGTVVTDKDFGSGYAFDVLIEEASLVAD